MIRVPTVRGKTFPRAFAAKHAGGSVKPFSERVRTFTSAPKRRQPCYLRPLMTGPDIGELRGKVLAILSEVLGDERAERTFALALSSSPAASLRDDYSLCVFVGGPLYGAVTNEGGKELADHLMQRMRPLMD